MDHVRAVSFSICDGQLPSNNKAGYEFVEFFVVQLDMDTFPRIQRAVYLQLVDALHESLGNAFPELDSQKDLIKKVIKQEEESFLRTLEKGIERLEGHLKNMNEGEVLSGKDAFELYDTFGFPSDLTALIAGERGIKVDKKSLIKSFKPKSTVHVKTEKFRRMTGLKSTLVIQLNL